jgi:hypothetical protein
MLATEGQACAGTVRQEGEAIGVISWRRRCTAVALTRVARTSVTIVLFGIASALGAASAQARTVCGTAPAVGVAYRVASAHLELHLTGHFSDAEGDHEEASITMTSNLSRPLGPSLSDGALFFACPGKKPVWTSHTALGPLCFVVSSSWYEPHISSGEPPTSGTCDGSFHAEPGINASWHAELFTGAGLLGIPPTPELAVGTYVNATRVGGCEIEDREILRDAAAAGLDHSQLEKFSLPDGKLRHAARRVSIPVDAGYSGKVPLYGYREYAPGPVSTLEFRWQGEITFSRAYTCPPNGCRLPEELNGT